jgi:MoaA/NifB/PqqE/SkfB family radical SAM enzyme
MTNDMDNKDFGVHASSDMFTEKHGGHKVRSGRRIVDRSKLDHVSPDGDSNKVPNQYTGHTYKNTAEKFRLDGHKLIYHMERVHQWMRGERVAPIQIDMGLTKFCNVGCIYCIGVTQGGMSRDEIIRPDALLRFIEDCGRLDVKSVAFIGDGEPTLNPALYDAIVFGKKLGVDTGTATNGLLLDMDRAHDVLRDSTFLRINLSAGDPKGFRRIHQSKAENFHKLVEKIRELVKIKKRHQYHCTLGIQMVLIPENFDQVLRLAQLGGELGVDYLQIKQCSDTEYRELAIDPLDYERVVPVLREAEKMSSPDYMVNVKWNKINILKDTEVYKHGFRKYDICYGTPFLGQISGSGKVYPCGPFFGKERFYMGDINKESYYDIVKSDPYWVVQNDILKNVDVHCDCTIGCRQDYINKFLSDLKNPPDHINFI